MTVHLLSLLALLFCASNAVQYVVQVGSSGLTFTGTPATVQPGDTVVFLFASGIHTVVVQVANSTLSCTAGSSSIQACSWTTGSCNLGTATAAATGTNLTFPIVSGMLPVLFFPFCLLVLLASLIIIYSLLFIHSLLLFIIYSFIIYLLTYYSYLLLFICFSYHLHSPRSHS
jgi:plastocyanin